MSTPFRTLRIAAASLVLVGCYGSATGDARDAGVMMDTAVDPLRDAEADASRDGGVHVTTMCVPGGEDAGVFALGAYRDTIVGVDVREYYSLSRLAFLEITLNGDLLHRAMFDLPSSYVDLFHGALFPMWSGEIVFVSKYHDLLVGCDLEAETCRSLPLPVLADLSSAVRYDFFSDGRHLYAAYLEDIPMGAAGFLRMDLRAREPTWEAGWRAYASASGDFPADAILGIRAGTGPFGGRPTLGGFELRRVGLIDAVLTDADGLPVEGRYRVVAMDWPCAVAVTAFSPIWDDDLATVPFVEPSGDQVNLSSRDTLGLPSTLLLRQRTSDSTVVGEFGLGHFGEVPDMFEFADGRFVLTDGWYLVVMDAAITTATDHSSSSGIVGVHGGPALRYPPNYPGDTTIVP